MVRMRSGYLRSWAVRREIEGFASIARQILSALMLGGLTASFSPSVALADVIPPKVNLTTPTGMSIPDTEFRVSSTDLELGSLKLERFSQSPSPYWPNYSQFGMSMTSNFDMYVQTTFIKASGPPFNVAAHYHAVVHIGNSAYSTYRLTSITGAGTIGAHNVDARAGILKWSGAAFQFTDKSGNVYTFSPSVSAHPTSSGVLYGNGTTPLPKSQRIDHINFADGSVWQFYYDSSQRLKLVTDSSGYAILFDYGANGFVSYACAIDRARSYVTATSTCAGQPLTVSYQYGTTTAPYLATVPVLASFTDVRGQTTSYTRFATSQSVACVVPPGQTGCQMQLSGVSGGGKLQTLADGGIWTFSSVQNPYEVNDPEVPPAASYGASVEDPAGKTTSYIFAGSSPLKITDPDGNITMFKWCCSQVEDVGSATTFDGTTLREATFPEGNKYSASYGTFNLPLQEQMQAKPGSGLPDQIVTYSYGATLPSGVTLGKPTAKTDANGNTTNWTYTSFGAVATEMQPAPSSGAPRPFKVNTYVQKYAYVLNGGSLVASGGPIWKINTETQCQTAAGSSTPVCDSSAPQRVTTYEYGLDGTADNLLVRGVVVTADGQTLRTCYGYDVNSNKSFETKPRAGLASCS